MWQCAPLAPLSHCRALCALLCAQLTGATADRRAARAPIARAPTRSRSCLTTRRCRRDCSLRTIVRRGARRSRVVQTLRERLRACLRYDAAGSHSSHRTAWHAPLLSPCWGLHSGLSGPRRSRSSRTDHSCASATSNIMRFAGAPLIESPASSTPSTGADALQVEATSRVEIRAPTADVAGMSPMQKRRQRLRLRAVDAVIAAVKASGIRMRSLVRRRPAWLR